MMRRSVQGEAMFGWFKKKPPVEQTEPYQMGRQFSSEMIGVFEQLMKERFGPVYDNYLNVLRGNFQTAMQRTDAPPLTVARIDYKIFLDEVKSLQDKMLEEIGQVMHKWVEVSDQMGVRAETEKMFQQNVENYGSELSMAGLKLFTDYAVPIKDADLAWRNANPEKAREFPEGD
jgi:hypothetical protein